MAIRGIDISGGHPNRVCSRHFQSLALRKQARVSLLPSVQRCASRRSGLVNLRLSDNFSSSLGLQAGVIDGAFPETHLPSVEDNHHAPPAARFTSSDPAGVGNSSRPGASPLSSSSRRIFLKRAFSSFSDSVSSDRE